MVFMFPFFQKCVVCLYPTPESKLCKIYIDCSSSCRSLGNDWSSLAQVSALSDSIILYGNISFLVLPQMLNTERMILFLIQEKSFLKCIFFPLKLYWEKKTIWFVCLWGPSCYGWQYHGQSMAWHIGLWVYGDLGYKSP